MDQICTLSILINMSFTMNIVFIHYNISLTEALAAISKLVISVTSSKICLNSKDLHSVKLNKKLSLFEDH